jgi:hypothetical protein
VLPVRAVDDTPAGEALVNKFLLETGPVKNSVLIIFRMGSFLLPSARAQEEVSLLFTLRTCLSSKGKFHKIVETPL